jgi:hypothetical protein
MYNTMSYDSTGFLVSMHMRWTLEPKMWEKNYLELLEYVEDVQNVVCTYCGPFRLYLAE